MMSGPVMSQYPKDQPAAAGLPVDSIMRLAEGSKDGVGLARVAVLLRLVCLGRLRRCPACVWVAGRNAVPCVAMHPQNRRFHA
jgi:hypothetical protein